MTSPTSEVVARLRSRKGEAITRTERLMDEAADRIETLERLLAEAREVLEWYADRVGGVMAWSVEGAKARADLSADNGRRAYEIMEPSATLSIGGVNGQ